MKTLSATSYKLKDLFIILITLFIGKTSAQTLTATDMLSMVHCADSACFSPLIHSKGFAFKNVQSNNKAHNKAYGYLKKYTCNTLGDSCDIVLFFTIGTAPAYTSLWVLPPDDDFAMVLQQFIKYNFEKFEPTGATNTTLQCTYYRNTKLGIVFVDEKDSYNTHSVLLVKTNNFNPAIDY